MTLAAVGFSIFCLLVAIIGIITVMLFYHWVRYGIGVAGTFAIMAIYAVGTAVLLLALLGLVEQL